MGISKKSTEKLTLELTTAGMSEQQVRLLKRVNQLMTEVLTSEYEDEYFDVSSELFKVVAMVVKTSSFNEEKMDIDYDQQVLEYCADVLSDHVYQRNVASFDN
tara:strand:- start:1109 stop:1417 length:309 start_codon:yes stop_codon:yes gene_type:complete